MSRRLKLVVAVGALPALIVALLVGIGAMRARPVAASGPGPTPTPTAFVCPGPWYHISSPNAGAYANALHAVAAVTANDVWAVGESQDSEAGGNAVPQIEHWNGAAWTESSYTASGHAGVGGLFGMAVVSKRDVWAVGSTGDEAEIGHWDGKSWQLQIGPTPANGHLVWLNAVAAVSANDIWAVGNFTSVFGFQQTLVEHWDGTSWTVVPSPNRDDSGNLNGVVALSSSDVWAVGYFRTSGVGVKQTLVEHWGGTSWTVVPSPSTHPYQDNVLAAVAAASAYEVWAVGYSVPGVQQSLVERWDGTSWTLVPSPNLPPDVSGTSLTAISVAPNGTIWAVGGDGFETAQQVIMDWDGHTWTIVPGPAAVSSSGYLSGIEALTPHNLWAVGSNNGPSSGEQQTLTEQYRAPDHETGMGNGTQCPHPNLGGTQP